MGDYVYAEVSNIDYEKLFSKINKMISKPASQSKDQEEKDALKKKVNKAVEGIKTGVEWSKPGFGKKVAMAIGKPIYDSKVKKAARKITGFAEDLGITLATFRLNKITIVETGGSNMLSITVSIDSIEWEKIAERVCSSQGKAEGRDNTMQEVFEIIGPHIKDIMAVFPDEDIAKLLNLQILGSMAKKEAGKYGVSISDFSVSSG